MDPLRSISAIAASGMHAQSHRLKVTAENVANANSIGSTPGEEPYRRQTISFAEMLERDTGATLVRVDEIGRDQSEFPLRYDPGHPAADESGYVRTPNVSSISAIPTTSSGSTTRISRRWEWCTPGRRRFRLLQAASSTASCSWSAPRP